MAVGKGGCEVGRRWRRLGWLGLGSHEATHEEEEVENEEEVLGEAEAAVLGRHLLLEGRAISGRVRTEEVLAVGETDRKTGCETGRERERARKRKGERKNTEKEEVPWGEPHPLPLPTSCLSSVPLSLPLSPTPLGPTHQYLRGLGVC